MGGLAQYTTRSCWLWPGHLDWWFSEDEETNQLNGLTPVDRIDELSPYPLETVSEDGFCHPFVGFEADRLGLVEPIADFVRPAEGDGKAPAAGARREMSTTRRSPGRKPGGGAIPGSRRMRICSGSTPASARSRHRGCRPGAPVRAPYRGRRPDGPSWRPLAARSLLR